MPCRHLPTIALSPREGLRLITPRNFRADNCCRLRAADLPGGKKGRPEEMKGQKPTPEITIGHGVRHAYLILGLFLTGMAVGGVAVHNFMNARGYYLPTALSILLMLAALFLAALKTDEERTIK